MITNGASLLAHHADERRLDQVRTFDGGLQVEGDFFHGFDVLSTKRITGFLVNRLNRANHFRPENAFDRDAKHVARHKAGVFLDRFVRALFGAKIVLDGQLARSDHFTYNRIFGIHFDLPLNHAGAALQPNLVVHRIFDKNAAALDIQQLFDDPHIETEESLIVARSCVALRDSIVSHHASGLAN
ncbi:MAG: hypothetical protein Q8M20_14460 [Rhodocyclaceae bacterium]|nr:hypothetical protein [Rhodocyclaceae bacterium]